MSANGYCQIHSSIGATCIYWLLLSLIVCVASVSASGVLCVPEHEGSWILFDYLDFVYATGSNRFCMLSTTCEGRLSACCCHVHHTSSSSYPLVLHYPYTTVTQSCTLQIFHPLPAELSGQDILPALAHTGSAAVSICHKLCLLPVHLSPVCRLQYFSHSYPCGGQCELEPMSNSHCPQCHVCW